MKLNELINPDLMRRMLEGGYIKVQRHPSLPLSIYNYTEKAQLSKTWNTATLACRGLIVNDYGEIVARPFEKFFNYEESKPKGSKFRMSMEEPVAVTDKMDGSLGILYDRGDQFGYAIATRGSFTSDQARQANMIWLEKYYGFPVPHGWTMLFEIVYPDNRIVVDYGGMNDLVLLGGVDIDSGTVVGPDFFSHWTGPVTETFPYHTLTDALSAPPRAGKEGLVVRSLSDGLMVKIKQEDYVALHKIVTGLNERVVWERLLAGTDLLENIPNEFHEWVVLVANNLRAKRQELWFRLDLDIQGYERYPELFLESRKEFALCIEKKESWLRSALWMWYDGKDAELHEFLWRQVKPRGESSAQSRTPDAG